MAKILNDMTSSPDLEAGDIRQNGNGSDLQFVLPGGDRGIAQRDTVTLHSNNEADLLEVIMVIVTVNIGEIKIPRTLILMKGALTTEKNQVHTTEKTATIIEAGK